MTHSLDATVPMEYDLVLGLGCQPALKGRFFCAAGEPDISDGLHFQKDTSDRQIGRPLGLNSPGKGCRFFLEKDGKAHTVTALWRCSCNTLCPVGYACTF